MFAALLICGAAAFANTSFNYSGAFSADDNMVLFNYVVQNQSQVDIFTTSYATGGFSPVITVFDSTGLFQFESRGISSDASLSWVSNAGETYLVVLTEWDNVSMGPLSNFADGFTEQGQGNFTAKPPFNPPLPGGFYQDGGVQRTSAWALTISSPDNTLVVTSPTVVTPEPGSAGLIFVSAALLAGCKRIRRAV
jgi:hypothetical protein